MGAGCMRATPPRGECCLNRSHARWHSDRGSSSSLKRSFLRSLVQSAGFWDAETRIRTRRTCCPAGRPPESFWIPLRFCTHVVCPGQRRGGVLAYPHSPHRHFAGSRRRSCRCGRWESSARVHLAVAMALVEILQARRKAAVARRAIWRTRVRVLLRVHGRRLPRSEPDIFHARPARHTRQRHSRSGHSGKTSAQASKGESRQASFQGVHAKRWAGTGIPHKNQCWAARGDGLTRRDGHCPESSGKRSSHALAPIPRVANWDPPTPLTSSNLATLESQGGFGVLCLSQLLELLHSKVIS